MRKKQKKRAKKRATTRKLITDVAGVPYEREVRNAREAVEELATIMN